jgi:hypothetical protein
MLVTFLDQLRDAAEARARAESDYRDESRRQLAALALERTRAYRRYHLLKELADVAAAETEPDASVRAQLALATQETGWSEGADGYADLCEHLGQVASLIHAALQANEGQTAEHGSDVPAAFAAFEAWHRERFGGEFLDRVRRESSTFHSVVDF